MAKANQPNSQQKPQPDRPDDLNQDQQEPYVPASPVKRTMAWIGIVYMLHSAVSHHLLFLHRQDAWQPGPPAHRARADWPGGADFSQLALHRPPPAGGWPLG